jgi:5'-3' exonuclease
MVKREEEWMRVEYKKRGEMRYSMSGEKEEIMNNAPLIYREVEHYINPMEAKWEERYYKALFVGKVCIEKVCANYNEMLEWVYDYYTGECKDWRCKYESESVVLLKDMKEGVKKCVKRERKALNVETQKKYVLAGEISGEVEIKWAYRRYLWEGQMVL